MSYNPLTPEEQDVIEHKGTERPFTGEYDYFFQDGVFICRKCNTPLFTAQAKFDAGCGWPAFDANLPHVVKRSPIDGGAWDEITCANCGAHLDHVNSISIRFIPKGESTPPPLHG